MCRYKLAERKIKILINLNKQDEAADAITFLHQCLDDATLDKQKKRELSMETENLVKCFKVDSSVAHEEFIDNTIVKHKVEKPHRDLPFLSEAAEIKFARNRGRFAVAQRSE